MFKNKGLYGLICISLIFSTALRSEQRVYLPSLHPVSLWKIEGGPQYWTGTGTYAVYLKGEQNEPVSRITYKHLVHNTAEGYLKIQYNEGLYLKGSLGGGSIPQGDLIDEDFPPTVTPYSNTFSIQRYGYLNYLNVDLGYDVLKRPQDNVSFFIGYQYWQERFNGFGCQQLEAESDICALSPEPFTENGLDEVPRWHTLRIGLNARKYIQDYLSLIVDSAYIYSYLNAVNYHNARPDILGYSETGKGNGTQIDLLLNWKFADYFNVGLGGRWWYVLTQGLAHFEKIAVDASPQPVTISQSRYGVLLKANYQLDRTGTFLSGPILPNANNMSKGVFYDNSAWPSIYVGGNIGYGRKQNPVNIMPNSLSANHLIYLYHAAPNRLDVQNAGFIGGGQVGYNLFNHPTLIGLEGDFNYTQVAGTKGIGVDLPGIDSILTTVNKTLNWISTSRLRVGWFPLQNSLAFLTVGAAFGEAELSFDQREFGVVCTNSTVCASGKKSKIKPGWSVGGGMEFQMNNNFIIKADYLYLSLEPANIAVYGSNGFGSAVNYTIRSPFNFNMMRLGINYKVG